MKRVIRHLRFVPTIGLPASYLHPHDVIVGVTPETLLQGPSLVVERRPPFQSRISKKRR